MQSDFETSTYQIDNPFESVIYDVLEEKINKWLDQKSIYITDPLQKMDEYFLLAKNNLKAKPRTVISLKSIEDIEGSEESTFHSTTNVSKESGFFLKGSSEWTFKNRRKKDNEENKDYKQSVSKESIDLPRVNKAFSKQIDDE